jgi:hypothetical protein
LIDRRLVGRNQWRNTTNAFDGFRLQLGRPAADWQFDFFAVQPVERRLVKPDRGDEERWFYGLVGAWRRWAKIVTVEPYWFILDEDRKGREVADREIHTMGLHVFGPVGETGFDYDVDTAFQFGPDGDHDQRAFAMRGDVGYSFKHEWKPRVSLLVAYASGDRDPDDSLNERFDRLFGVSHPFSMQNLLTWQNLISTKILLDLRPTEKLRVFAAYGPYWLASDSDSWTAIGRHDPAGDSGDFLGQEIEVAARYEIDPRIELELGYSHFMPGAFLGDTGPADVSNSRCGATPRLACGRRAHQPRRGASD